MSKVDWTGLDMNFWMPLEMADDEASFGRTHWTSTSPFGTGEATEKKIRRKRVRVLSRFGLWASNKPAQISSAFSKAISFEGLKCCRFILLCILHLFFSILVREKHSALFERFIGGFPLKCKNSYKVNNFGKNKARLWNTCRASHLHLTKFEWFLLILYMLRS